MIDTILGFFGYCKIPQAAIRLSICQESFLEGCLKHESDDREKEMFKKFLDGQRVLTEFLRSGKLLQ